MKHGTKFTLLGSAAVGLLMGVCAVAPASASATTAQIAPEYRAFCSEYKASDKHNHLERHKFEEHCRLDVRRKLEDKKSGGPAATKESAAPTRQASAASRPAGSTSTPASSGSSSTPAASGSSSSSGSSGSSSTPTPNPPPAPAPAPHDRSGKDKGNNGKGTATKNDGGDPPGGGKTSNDTN